MSLVLVQQLLLLPGPSGTISLRQRLVGRCSATLPLLDDTPTTKCGSPKYHNLPIRMYE